MFHHCGLCPYISHSPARLRPLTHQLPPVALSPLLVGRAREATRVVPPSAPSHPPSMILVWAWVLPIASRQQVTIQRWSLVADGESEGQCDWICEERTSQGLIASRAVAPLQSPSHPACPLFVLLSVSRQSISCMTKDLCSTAFLKIYTWGGVSRDK